MTSPLRAGLEGRAIANDVLSAKGRKMLIDGQAAPIAHARAFDGLPNDLIQEFEEISVVRFLRKSDPLYWLDDQPDGLWRVETGHLSYSIAPNERGPILFDTLRPGQFFGASELFERQPREATVIAREKSQVTLYPLRSIERLAVSRPEIWRWLGHLTSKNASTFMAAADDLLIRSCRERLIAVMLRLTGTRHQPLSSARMSRIEVTQEELAMMANLSRSVVAQLVADFKKDGLVASGYGHMMLLDLPRLRASLDE